MSHTLLTTFCYMLLESGSGVIVRDAWMLDQSARDATAADLLGFEKSYRLSLPHQPPKPQPAPLVWGAQTLAWAASLLVDRDQGDTQLPQELRSTFPKTRDPETLYSVDIMLRFLPSLVERADNIDPHDPLLATLRELAESFPLSSVGAAGLNSANFELSAIEAQPCLRRLYVDRIVERRDKSRVGVDWIRATIAADAGDYSEMSLGLIENE